MSKLYIFGIGGTGSRVLKSLTMLLASGVDINATEIVPIIIDPDHAAADLTRTVELMRNYSGIREELVFNSSTQNRFFKTPINLNILPNVTMPLKKTQDQKFKEYIGLDLMKDANGNYDANYALATMLFSEKNLEASMDVGFKGNPNIGSVVLNQFSNSHEFNKFAASFDNGDRIFIISSIFGGTGASGFPLLLKNIRSISQDVPGNANVKNAPIGAITVLPYFDVELDNEKDENKRSQIDSSTFISKTKAALSYYDRNMNETNVLYYIGDTVTKQYENSEGGTTQRNAAHFVELAAALSIIDFASIPDQNLQVDNGLPKTPFYREFGIKNIINNNNDIIFSDLSTVTTQQIQQPLTQFTLFNKYMKEQFLSTDTQWMKEREFDDNFRKSPFYQTKITDFGRHFSEWLEEMQSNKRAFAPFDLREKTKDLFSFVKGVEPKKLFLEPASNYDLFNKYLNEEERKLPKDSPKESLFVELFYTTTKKLIDRKKI